MDKIQYQYKYVPISETINLEARGYEEVSVEDSVLDEIGKRFTQHLAASMGNTKETLAAQLLGGALGEFSKPKYEIEVDFE